MLDTTLGTACSSPPRFHLYTPEEIDDFPDPLWLIDSLIQDEAFVLLYGQQNVGKSFVALDIALSVATGRKWLGRDVRQGPVVYIVGEGRSGLKKRLRAWQEFHGEIRNFYAVCSPVQLADQGEVDELLGQIRAAGVVPRLCIFDTLATCFAGGDENGSAGMGLITDAVTRIRREHKTTVLLVHHTGRKGDTPRGHSILDAASDTMVLCSPADSDGANIVLRCKKQKDAEWFEDIDAVMVDAGTPPYSSRVLTPGKGVSRVSKDETALTVLQRLGRATLKEWRMSSGIAPSTFSKVKDRLIASGSVRADIDGKHFLPVTAEEIPVATQNFLPPTPLGGGGENGQENSGLELHQ